MVLFLFQEAQELAVDNVRTLIYDVMKQATVEVFFNGGSHELLEEKMYKLAGPQQL